MAKSPHEPYKHDVHSPWTSVSTPPRPRGLHLRVRRCAPTERASQVRGTKPLVNKQEVKPHQRSKDFIAFCAQRLQRVTSSKPSKNTNTLPLTWQSLLSWGGIAAYKGNQVLGRHFGRATRKAREAISRPCRSKGMPFSQAFF